MEDKKFKDGLTLEEAKKEADISQIINTKQRIAIIEVYITPITDKDGKVVQQNVQLEYKIAEGVCEPELGRALENFAHQLKGQSYIPKKRDEA